MTAAGLSFEPKEPTGKGRGRTFAYTDDQWQELYEKATSLSVADRDALCRQYHVAFQTLARKTGNAAPSPRGSSASASASANESTGSRAAARSKPAGRSRDEVISGIQEHIDALEEDLTKSRKRLERIESMDDEEYSDMMELLIG